MAKSITALERRKTRRYLLRLPIHYRVSDRGGPPYSGSGTTCEMSTTGLSFRCRRLLPVGSHVELLVAWPSRHQDIDPIELQITGFIVRAEGGKTGIRMTSHKFRVDQESALAMSAIA